MGSIAVGRIRVDGTTPSAPLHSLLSTPGIVVNDNGRWDGGVNLWGYTNTVPATWHACAAGTYRNKDEGDSVEAVGFDSFVIYTALNCSTFGIATDIPGFFERANAVLEATESYAVEKALAQGVEDMSNPYLGDGNLLTPAPGVMAPEIALAALEQTIGATGRRGVIHLTPAVAARLDTSLSNNNLGELVTLSGNTVVVGGGYIGTDPVNETAHGDTTDWVFATGPVQVRITGRLPETDDISSAVDHETNDVIYRAEKLVNVSWDTSLQVGFLVDWATCCESGELPV